MPRFSDSLNDVWDINLTVGLVEDVKSKTSVDLDILVKEPERLGEYLAAEPRKIAELLYVLCEKQIESREMTPRDFAMRLDRPTLDKAIDTFLEAVVLFFPRGSVGQTLRDNLPRILERMDTTAKKETQKRLEKLLATPIG